jgi:hypothetical protein
MVNVTVVQSVPGRTRVLAWLAAALMLTVLSAIAAVAGFTILTRAFMTHDARRMPVEPDWAGPVALFGGVAAVAALVGYVLGRSTGLRAGDGLVTGMLGGTGLAASWHLTLVWRGYQVSVLDLPRAFPIVLTAALITALCAEWGGRVRASLR